MIIYYLLTWNVKICFISAKFSANNDLLINSTIKNKNCKFLLIIVYNMKRFKISITNIIL